MCLIRQISKLHTAEFFSSSLHTNISASYF